MTTVNVFTFYLDSIFKVRLRWEKIVPNVCWLCNKKV